MKRFTSAVMALLMSSPVLAAGMGADDPLVYKVMIDQLEVRSGDHDNPTVLEADAWIGKDLNKLWVKTEVEEVGGETEEAVLQLLYSRAVAPFWDFQAGWRTDIKPEPQRDWLALGFKGLAPYLFEVDANLFIGESGQYALGLQAEYEYMFTQRLYLSPEVEMNLYAKDDEELGIGSGLADMQLGVRLVYEVRREFAPYIGVNWWSSFGKTADLAEAVGEETSDTQLVAGIRAWF